MTGMEMSIRITSGISSRAISTACWPSTASPTTSKSLSAARRLATPRRKRAWSSASSTRMVLMRRLPGASPRRACRARAPCRSPAVPPGPRRARAWSGGRSGARSARPGASHPTPSSSTVTRSQAPSRWRRTRARSAAACFRTLVSASWMMRTAWTSEAGGTGPSGPPADLELDGDPVVRAELVQVLGEGGNEAEPARDEGAEAEDRLAHLFVGAVGDAAPSRAGPRRRPARRPSGRGRPAASCGAGPAPGRGRRASRGRGARAPPRRPGSGPPPRASPSRWRWPPAWPGRRAARPRPR